MYLHCRGSKDPHPNMTFDHRTAGEVSLSPVVNSEILTISRQKKTHHLGLS